MARRGYSSTGSNDDECILLYIPHCGVRPRPFSNARRRERHLWRARLVAAPRSSSVQLPAAGTLIASDAVTAAAATTTSTKTRDDDELGARAMAGRRQLCCWRCGVQREQRASVKTTLSPLPS
jgi:hypothetical protein